MPKVPYVIAEVKTRSPFGFVSHRGWGDLFAIADTYGDMVSVHTDARWGGSFELLKKASHLTTKPLLAKGIHSTDLEVRSALQHGATSVLVVGRLPDKELLPHCFIEPRDLQQLKDFARRLPSTQKIVWNSRDLQTGYIRNPNEFVQARNLWPGWLCQASNISVVQDVQKQADAVLVGQELERFTQSLQTNWLK